METIRWGIIGCGNVTEVKSGPGFQKARGSELVAVMRRNADRAADYARRHAVPKWYDDAQKLIDDPEVDAIYVATPPVFHAEYAIRCARARKPVYVEKPMALNHAECQEMIRACADVQVPLFVAYYRRGLPRFLKAKELIESGAIGHVRYVRIALSRQPLDTSEGSALPWRVVPKIAGGGLFVDLACHTLDFLDYVLGPITDICGHASNQAGLYPAEDIVDASFRFLSGVQGTGSWCFSAFENADVVEVVGSEGKVRLSTYGVEPVLWVTAEGATEFAIPNPPHVQGPLIQSVVDDLLGVSPCPSTGESAARTSWVMDQLLEEYRESH